MRPLSRLQPGIVITFSFDTFLAIAITALGVIVMIGWALHSALLVQVDGGYVYMAFNTALCFALLGIGLLMPDSGRALQRRWQWRIGGIVLLFSALVLSQDILDTDWHIDQLFTDQNWISNLSNTPGRMAPQTSFCFMLAGAYLLCRHARASQGMNLLLPLLAVIIMAIAILSLTGYWLNLEVMYSWYHYTRMAVHTAIGFMLLGLALWLLWYRSASTTVFYQREDRRISALAAMLLTLITLTAGMSGFALMARQMEDSLRSSFDSILQNQYDLLNFVLSEETNNAKAMSKYLLMNRLIHDLNQQPDATETMQTLTTVVNSVMARNYSAIALYGLSGNKLVETGHFVPHSELTIKLDAQDTLLWDQGAVLHSVVELYHQNEKVGLAVVERQLTAVTGLLLNNRYIGNSDEITVCSDAGVINGVSTMNCLPSRNHPYAFIHQPRIVNGKRLMMDYALRGETGTHTGIDYAGNIVIAATRQLAPWSLGVVMKMNASELYNPVRDKLSNILLLILLLVAISILALRSKLVPLVRQLIISERDAKASKARVQAIMENVDEGIITINEKGLIETFNPAIARIFGYEPQELLGQNIKILMPVRMRAPHQEGMERHLQFGTSHVIGKGALELPGLHKNGHELALMLTVTEMWLEEKRLFVGSIRDITESKKAQEALRLSEERLHLATSGTSDGLWDWDIATGYLYHSPRFCDMLGYDEQELPNHIDRFFPLMHAEDLPAVTSALDLHFQHLQPYDIEYRLRHKDGTFRWINSRGQASWTNGKVVRMTGFVTDITRRKEAERIKNEFVSTVSHELRTPLTSIRGSLGLILGGITGEMNEKMRGLVDIAHKNCERLILLINDILDVEKIASGQMRYDLQWLSIKDIILQSLELNRSYGEKYQVRFTVHGELHDAPVHVDGSRLNQVMSNLLSNAAKFSQPGSAVEIFTEDNGNNVRVSVANYGPAIPQSFHSRIFGKFAQADSSDTRQKGGTGLGLNISKSIIEYFGGTIDFTSTDGKTVFYFDLPKTHAHWPAAASALRERILICEDDADIAHLLKTILEGQGFEVDIAYTAMQAKLLVETRVYIAMTVDLTLPDEDGVTLIRDIRASEAGRLLPIIVVSARAEDGKKELNGHAIGIVDWMTKPLDTERLINAVMQLARNKEKPVVLHVEDDEDVVQIVAYGLQGIAQLVHLSTVADATEYLSNATPDLILLDVSLPDGSGLQLLELLGTLTIPVIIFSATEVSQHISEKVMATLVKSRTSETAIISTIIRLIERQSRKD